jgi:hypothetical protein
MYFLKAFLIIPLVKEGYPRCLRPSTHSINSAYVRHFGGLKVSFFKGRETLDQQVSCKHKAYVRPFGGNVSTYWLPEKAIPAMSFNPQTRLSGFSSTTARHFGYFKKLLFTR